MNKNNKIIIGYAGLTHLGIISLIAATEKGFKVIAFDLDNILIESLERNIINISEPYLKKYLNNNRKNITFTSNVDDLKHCNFIYLSEDINTDSSGISNITKLDNLFIYLSKKINKKIPIIILSQVPPGYTRKKKKKFKNIYYQVETLVFGNAVKRALNPERIIFGKNTNKSKIDDDIIVFLKSFNCKILYMNYESAELCKISVNLFLASSITTTNYLANLSEKINADWYKIIPALQMDKRIGKFAYLYPGLGISGGNLQRDLVTVLDISKKNKIDNRLIKQFIYNSAQSKLWLIKKFQLIVSKNYLNLKVSILGISYKENTNSIKNSPALDLINSNKRLIFSIYDPILDLTKIKLKNCTILKSVKESIIDKDIVIIMNKSKEFKILNDNNIFKKNKVKYIIDPLNFLNKVNLKNIKKFSIGL